MVKNEKVNCNSEQERDFLGKTTFKIIIFAVSPDKEFIKVMLIAFRLNPYYNMQVKTMLFGVLLLITLEGVLAQSDTYDQMVVQGKTAATNRQYGQAIQYFGQAIKLDPRRPEAYLRQMESAIHKRDMSVFKRAILQLEGIEYKLPLEMYLTYAQLAKKQRLYNDGLMMLGKAKKKFKINKKILLQQASLYQKLNKTTEAIAALNEALKLDRKDGAVLHQLALVYMAVDEQKSIDYLKQLLNNKAYTNAALATLGSVYIQRYEKSVKGNRADLLQALSYYNQYLKVHPNDKEAQNIISNIQILLKG